MTEASHLRTLRVLDLIFYQRMKKENLMPREELARLFPNLPELIEIHSEETSSPPHPSGQPSGFCPLLPTGWDLPVWETLAVLLYSLKPAFQLPPSILVSRPFPTALLSEPLPLHPGLAVSCPFPRFLV